MPVEFVDTNVVVYAYDRTAGRKHQVAKALLERLWRDRTAGTSIQVLQEFFVTVTRKVPVPLDADSARKIVVDLGRWHLVEPTHGTLLNAIDAAIRHKISLWDAMIIAAAQEMGAEVLWSEDLSNGQVYDGVEVRNPFEESDS